MQTAYDVHSILVDGGFSLGVDTLIDLFNWVIDGGAKDNFEKACIIDFVIRHNGRSATSLSWDMFKRYTGFSHTNRCSRCHYPGHNKNHCPWA